MASTTKNVSVDPATRFAADFTHLISDVDRLAQDLGADGRKGKDHKRGGTQRTLNGTLTSLREHSEAFIESLRHYEVLFDGLPISFMELDSKARIVRANKQCAEMLNGSGKPLTGKSLFTFVKRGDSKRLREKLADAVDSNQAAVVGISMVQNGTSLPVEMSIRRVNGDAGYVAVVQNATHWTREGLEDARTLEIDDPMYELSLNLSRAPTLSEVGHILGKYCHQAFHSLAGILFVQREGELRAVSHWSSPQLPAKNLPDDVLKNGAVSRAFLTGQPVFWRRLRVSRSKLSPQPFRRFERLVRSVSFLPIAAPSGPIGVLVLVLPDVDGAAGYDGMVRLTDVAAGCIARASAFEDALTGRERAEKMIQNQDEFFSMLTHELKGPMTPILNWAVLLRSGTLSEEKANIALEVIVRNVRSLNYLVEDLLDAARISSGKLRLQLAQVRIQDVAREALAIIQQTIETKKLVISTEISEAVPPLTADSRRLQQVLVNLLSNAAKFTPEGGSISLHIRRRGSSVECIVSDTGKGIEKEFLPFVFDRFRQESRSSRSRASGLGLGLAIAREIVELHGGTIDASSDGANKGAKFVVRLPARKRHSRRQRQTAKAAGHS